MSKKTLWIVPTKKKHYESFFFFFDLTLWIIRSLLYILYNFLIRVIIKERVTFSQLNSWFNSFKFSLYFITSLTLHTLKLFMVFFSLLIFLVLHIWWWKLHSLKSENHLTDWGKNFQKNWVESAMPIASNIWSFVTSFPKPAQQLLLD